MTYKDLAGGPTLHWSIKSSFWQYVQNAGGNVSASAPWTVSEGAATAPVSVVRADEEIRVDADGGVRFTAHGGRLSVAIHAVSLSLEGDAATLSIEDPDDAPARLEIAKGSARRDGEALVIDLALGFFGCRLFGDVYQPGEALDPIVLRGIAS